MQTRKILSKKGKNIIKIDIIIIIICLIITNIKLMLESNTTLFSLAIHEFTIYQNYNIVFAIFSFLFIIISNFIFKNFFILLVYIPIRISYLSVIKKNKRYEVIDNIEYFREKFEELSPAEISLISDFEVENKKDLSATILKLYNKNLIDFENNNIIIISNNHPENLKESEEYLLDFLSHNNTLNNFNFPQWKAKCINEVLSDGYLIAPSTNKRKNFWFSTGLFLLSLCMFIHSIIFIATSPDIDMYMSKIDRYIEEEEKINKDIFGKDYDENNYSLIENHLKDHPEDTEKIMNHLTNSIKEISPVIFVTFEAIIGFILIISIPIYKAIRHASYNHYQNNTKYLRTNTGKIIAEQIAAMQRYIHEFSLLSDKEKEQVKIWDDYLVYAIILEENEKIIDDIFKYKNIEKNLFIYN